MHPAVALPPPTYTAAAARRSELVEAARSAAAARIEAAGHRMRERAWRRLGAGVDAQEIAPGDLVRVSLLVLPHVRRLLKSQLVGDPLPLFSTTLFRVTAARRAARHGRTVYDVECAACEAADPLPSVVGGCLAQLPAALLGVERRYLLRVDAGVRPTMGRSAPDLLPRVWV
jgi:hypothetical protein